MIFDITNINLLDFTRALIAFSKSLGYGEQERIFHIRKNGLVDSMTKDEFDELFFDFNTKDVGVFNIIDYYKGSPIKLYLEKKKNGRILFSSLGYDSRIGKYKVFEILLNLFHIDDYRIIQKSYGQFENTHFNKNLLVDDQVSYITILLKKLNKEKDEFGTFYKVPFGSYDFKLLNIDLDF